MLNNRTKYNEADAIMDSFYCLFGENKDESTLQKELKRIRELAELKENTEGKVPGLDCKFPEHIMIGTMSYPEEMLKNAGGFHEMKQIFGEEPDKIKLPVTVDLQKKLHLFVEFNEERLVSCQEFTHNIMWSFLSAMPVAKLNISVFDSERRGGSITPFLEFKKKAPHLFDEKIHTDAEDIHDRLKKFNEEIDERIQSGLGSRYNTIIDYNQKNPVRSEAIHLLVINDFPSGFYKKDLDLILNILKNGSKCGIYTIINYNRSIAATQEGISEIDIERIKRMCSVLEVKNNCCYPQGSLVPIEGYVPMPKDRVDGFIQEYLERTEEWKNKELDFRDILEFEFFAGNVTNSVDIPVGAGNGEIVNVTLGKGQHLLVAGAADSGKNALLHTIIMNSMLRYSPDKLNLYLLDFKEGDRFRLYGAHKLPHIKLLALDAVQEFGEGVLEDLFQKMEERNNMMKEAGVTKASDYAVVTGVPMPAILVVMEEFQVLLDAKNNRKVADNCASLLKRIAEEGKNAGIHFIMASESLKYHSESGVINGIPDWLDVRIGLKCEREEAVLLFKDNADKALEMMQGTAGNAVTGNAVMNIGHAGQSQIPFRVAYCDGDTQKEYLHMIENECDVAGECTKKFEGTQVHKLLDCYGQEKNDEEKTTHFSVKIGDFIKTMSPFGMVFDREKNHNVLIGGTREKMADNLFHLLMLGILKNKNSKVYCMDGELLNTKETTVPYYLQYERFEEQFHLLNTENDFWGLMEKIYALYEQKKMEEDSVLFVALKNFRLADAVCRLMKGEDVTGQEVYEKLIRLMQDGHSCGIHFILCDSETGSLSERVLAQFPERFLFALSNRDADRMGMELSTDCINENTVYYVNSEKKACQLKPYVFPGAGELEQYVNGLMGEENTAKWYRKASAEEKSGPAAMYYLGVMYENGQGVEKDYIEAAKCYEKSVDEATKSTWYSESDSIPAMYRLGLLYENGQGVTQSDKEAVKWYEKVLAAATDDNEDRASAMCRLGMLYERGRGVKQDYAEAAKRYKESKNAEAMYCLGQLYENGRGLEQNYTEAAKCYVKATNETTQDAKNSSSAMYRLGILYENGRGVEQNYTEAAKWYEKAAKTASMCDESMVSAMYRLGMLYESGHGVGQNYMEAVKWYENAVNSVSAGRAADDGNSFVRITEDGAAAMYRLGILYSDGRGVEQNYEKAMEWYEKSASNGNEMAMNNLGLMYEHGQGVKQNYEEAVKWYEKACQAGNAEAMNNIGWLYETGQGVEQNYAEAAKWYEKSANAGNATAMNNLGVFYNIGQGVEQDYAKAAKWYEKAAKAGVPNAMKNLGVLYKQGRGVAQNYGEAAKWYEKAANAGIASAMNNLGVLYDKGQGVRQDYAEAAKWYEKAAKAGIPDAMNNIGQLFERGQGVRQDYAEAAKWYEKAASAGIPDAMNNLGLLYEHGYGMPQNYAEAAKWYEKAASAGIQNAMINLAELYKSGQGVEQSNEEAAKWYEKAVNAGNAFAMKRLDELQTKEPAKKSFVKTAIAILLMIVIIIVICILVL